jgi:glutamyl endopeptidase
MEVFSVTNVMPPGPEAGALPQRPAIGGRRALTGQTRRNTVTGLETIIGTDERVAITEADQDPWRRICQLDLEGPMGVFKGTGWFAGPSTVITAGHCVHYATFFGGWAQKITVTPGRHRDKMPFGRAVSTRFSTLNLWRDGQAADWDIGCIHLDTPLGDQTGVFATGVLSDEDLTARVLNIAGYPTDKDLAKVMYHHANQVLHLSERRIFYEIDTVSGQSGAPVWVQDTEAAAPLCVGIHAYGVPGTPQDLHITANSAPRIDAQVAAIIGAWVEQGG